MTARISWVLASTSFLGLVGCGGSGSGGGGGGGAPGSFTPEVAFLADAEVDERVELYVADLGGSAFAKVSGPLVSGGSIRAFAWSPDRSMLAFLADKDADEVVELYVVGANGGSVTRVSGPLVAGGDVSDFRWSPTSARLAYRADQDEDEVIELFTVSAQGGPAVQVSGALVAGGQVVDFAWAPDDSRIAYAANQDELTTLEVFSSLAAGGGNVQVSGDMVPGGSLGASFFHATLHLERPFAWAPDSSRIAYLATQDDADVLELFTSFPDGGANTKVNAVLAPEDLVERAVYEFAWAPDSTRLAYAANQEENHEGDVFVAAPDGSGRVQVLDTDLEGIFATRLAWAPDGSHVAGIAIPFPAFLSSGAMFAAPAGGSAGVSSRTVDALAWAPDSSRLVLVTDAAVVTAEPADLLLVSAPVTPVSSLAPGEDVLPDSLAWSPDGSRVAYTSQDLHVSFPFTDYGAERITPLLHGTDRSVRQFEWTRDSSRLVFRADIFGAEVIDLFVAPRDGSDLIVLSPPLVFGGRVLDFAVR